MTEEEWLSCGGPQTLLSSLFARGGGKTKAIVPDERYRLFGIACCRRVQRALEFGDQYALDCLEIYSRTGLREALLKARRFNHAAGNAASHDQSPFEVDDRTARLLVAARCLATSAVWSCTKTKPTQGAKAYLAAGQAAATLRALDDPSAPQPPPNDWAPPEESELAVQADLLRDIFGNPFRSVAFDAAWRTSTAVALAKQMYESRDFGAMPILADALQDAGCDNDDILNHCRAAEATQFSGAG